MLRLKSLHRVLRRQLLRIGFNEDEFSLSQEQFEQLIATVNQCYQDNDEERMMSEHSLSESDRDMRKKIAEIEALTVQMAQTAKLASVGTLASGIAHELNNPLSFIKGYCELMLRTEANEKSIERLKKIIGGCQRMHAIISHLKKLSHSNTDKTKKQFRLDEAISETLVFLGARLENDCINISTEIPEDLIIEGDQYNFESVIQNLLTNSIDAYSANSEVAVTKEIMIRADATGDRVKIHYHDYAGGMPEQVVDRIFDPFFTTKQVGKGVGLGMALSRQVIKDIGGSIRVNTDSKTFSEFFIELPLVENFVENKDALMRQMSTRESPFKDSLNRKSILIIDDEENICDFLSDALAEQFVTIAVSNPAEGLKFINQGSFSLVISDLKMPGINGLKIVEACQQKNIPVVLISGHAANDPDLEKARELGIQSFMSKPFDDPETICKNIKQIIEESLDNAA